MEIKYFHRTYVLPIRQGAGEKLKNCQMKTLNVPALNDYKSLSIHQRINFRSQWLNWKCYGVFHAFNLMINEVYYGPRYYGSSPFPLGWDDSGCVDRRPK